MGQIFMALEKFFEEENWQVTQLKDKLTLTMEYSAPNGTFRCFAIANEEGERFTFYSFCPIKVPEQKRGFVADYVTRANYGLPIGNLEMDFDDGEIRTKTTVMVGGTEIDYFLIKHVVYMNLVIMNKYFPGISAIVYGNVSPVEAIRQVETN